MTKIAVSIIEENTDDCISVSNNCNTDLIELRIDYIKDINITKLDKILKNISKEIIITCRSKEFGGKYKGSEINRIKLLKHAISKNVKYIDIEIESDINDVNNLIKNKDNTKIILSHHNFDNTPPINELQKKYDQMNLLNPNLIKIVTFANSINDCFTIFRLLKDKHNLIGLCMGIKGNITRILAQKFNSYITYASVNKGKESAPGQLSINDLMNIYNFKWLCLLAGTDYNQGENNIFYYYKLYINNKLYIKDINIYLWFLTHNYIKDDNLYHVFDMFDLNNYVIPIKYIPLKYNKVNKVKLFTLLEKEFFLNPLSVT